MSVTTTYSVALGVVIAGIVLAFLGSMSLRGTYRFAVATAVATFLLLLVGGLVNPTGSSLACPDWPLCHGTAFPEMTGGVLFEHSHRLLATTVGLMTTMMAYLLFRLRKQDAGLLKLGLAAFVMVVAQGVLGGLTVLYKLPPPVSIGHLALSMLCFALFIYVATRLRRLLAAPRPALVSQTLRSWILGGLALLYLQIVLGAVVRHTHAALACLNEVPLCFGQVFPANAHYTAHLHMLHRLVGLLASLVLTAIGARVFFRVQSGPARWLGLAAPILAFVQMTLGILTVLTMKGLIPVELHLAVGVLLLADMTLLALCTRGVAVTAESAVPAGASRGAR